MGMILCGVIQVHGCQRVGRGRDSGASCEVGYLPLSEASYGRGTVARVILSVDKLASWLTLKADG